MGKRETETKVVRIVTETKGNTSQDYTHGRKPHKGIPSRPQEAKPKKTMAHSTAKLYLFPTHLLVFCRQIHTAGTVKTHPKLHQNILFLVFYQNDNGIVLT